MSVCEQSAERVCVGERVSLSVIFYKINLNILGFCKLHVIVIIALSTVAVSQYKSLLVILIAKM